MKDAKKAGIGAGVLLLVALAAFGMSRRAEAARVEKEIEVLPVGEQARVANQSLAQQLLAEGKITQEQADAYALSSVDKTYVPGGTGVTAMELIAAGVAPDAGLYAQDLYLVKQLSPDQEATYVAYRHGGFSVQNSLQKVGVTPYAPTTEWQYPEQEGWLETIAQAELKEKGIAIPEGTTTYVVPAPIASAATAVQAAGGSGEAFISAIQAWSGVRW